MREERIKRPEERETRFAVIRGGFRPEDVLAKEALDSPEALEALCDLYIPKMYGYVLKRVGSVADAEDITSTVFEKVIASLSTFDSGRASFATWIYRIATNCITDFYRARGRRRETPLAEEHSGTGPGSTGGGIEELDSYMALLELIGRLPRKYQESLALRYFADMSVGEVARTLELTETAASKRILRGLEALRKMTGGDALEKIP